jgi:SAM-dependent methyltransferase
MPLIDWINAKRDRLESVLASAGMLAPMTWDRLLQRPVRTLYAGHLRRGLPQWKTHYGLTPFVPSPRNIRHDITKPYPIADNAIDGYQSEDVFEHVPQDQFVAIVNEIHRVLKPGALFRLSLPDYHFDIYRDRTLRNEDGSFHFDPGGGGELDTLGRVADGGHLWFPTIEIVREMIEMSAFAGQARYLHYTNPDGTFVQEGIDYSLGNVQRTPDHDERVRDRPRPMSIVVDMTKAD